MKMKKKNIMALTASIITSLLFNSNPIPVYAQTTDKVLEFDINQDQELEQSDLRRIKIEVNDYAKDNTDEEEINKYVEARVEERKEEKRICEYDQAFMRYCSYFHLDSNMVIEVAKFMTENYTKDIELYVGNDYISYLEPDQFAMCFVHSLYYGDFSEYGYDVNNFKLDLETEHLNRNEEDEIVLSNGYTYSEYFGIVSDTLGVDRTLALAISNYESGFQTNSQSVNHNNFAGIKGTGTLPSPEAGIIHTVITIKRINSLPYVDDMYDLSGVYVNGNINNPSTLWVNSVTSIDNDITKNESDYFVLTR